MTGRAGSDGLLEDLARDLHEGAGRNPVYRRVLVELPAVLGGPAGARVAAAWQERTFNAWFDRPRLLLAALRLDVLSEGSSHPLWRALGPDADPDAVRATAVESALAPERTRVWAALGSRFVQTNETSRAVTWLWPAFLAGCDRGARALALLDVGASAGLNLVADSLPAPWTDEGGQPVPVVRAPAVVARVGVDAAPLDVRSEEGAQWLRALVWPGEAARLERLEAAIAAFRAREPASGGPVLERRLARDAPHRAAELSASHPDALVLATQTVVREYLGAPEGAEYDRGMDAWLLRERPGSAAWLQLEHATEGATREWPSWIVARWREGGAVRAALLARCGYHPSVLRVDEEGARAFASAFRSPP
jgi:hypothetical protein